MQTREEPHSEQAVDKRDLPLFVLGVGGAWLLAGIVLLDALAAARFVAAIYLLPILLAAFLLKRKPLRVACTLAPLVILWVGHLLWGEPWYLLSAIVLTPIALLSLSALPGRIRRIAIYSALLFMVILMLVPRYLLLDHAGVVAFQACRELAFSPDGSELAVATYTGIQLWDYRTGRQRLNLGTELRLHLAWGMDAKLLSAGGKIQLWDTRTGQLIRGMGHERNWWAPVAFSRDGTLMAYGEDKQAVLVNTHNGQVVWTVPSDGPGALAFSPDGRMLAVSADSNLVILEVNSKRVVRQVSITAYDLQFRPDGRLGVATHTGVYLYGMDSGQRQLTHDETYSLAFSPDGQCVATGEQERVVLRSAKTGRWLRSLPLPPHASDLGLGSLQFSPNGKWLAATSTRGVLLWRLIKLF